MFVTGLVIGGIVVGLLVALFALYKFYKFFSAFFGNFWNP